MNFAAIILSHGKPENVATYKTLRKQGYTGRIVILIDDEDPKLGEYLTTFPGEVEIFNKAESAATFDLGDNFKGAMKTVVFARNVCFPLAAKLGLTHFLELDDDYLNFYYTVNEESEFSHGHVGSLDRVFEIYLRYLDSTSALTVAMAQAGDFMGGAASNRAKQLFPWRKCMNTFFCRTDRPFTFLGRLNDDVSAYSSLGTVGKLMLTLPNVMITQAGTQSDGAGMAEIYTQFGTYVKSFYTLMRSPSCVKIREIGTAFRRIHHQINWKNCVPMIVSESLRKT